MIDTILLDMDGTLLPVDSHNFTRTYFGLLCAKVAPHGFKPEEFAAALKSGMKAMVKNDGSRTNREAFWDDFARIFGREACAIESICDDFYSHEFNQVKDILHIAVDRKPLIDMLRDKGFTIALANNPMLPPVGTLSRLGWIGLEPGDFDLLTDYSNCTYCKPNPAYYAEIIQKLGKRPEQCLMVGNSIADDATAAQAGCAVYIVDDLLEGDPEQLAGFMHGSFEAFCEYVRSMPAAK